MSGAVGKSKNKSSNQAGFNQDIWGGQGDALQRMYEQVGDMFNPNAGLDTGGMQGAFNKQMQGGAYSGMGLQNNFNALNRQMSGPSYTQQINQDIMGGAGNDYADAMKGQVMTDAGNLMDMSNARLDARAAAGGMGGSSRQGIAQAQSMKDINQGAQNQLTNIGYNTFDKNLDRNLGIASAADANNMGRFNTMSNMIGQQNQAMQGGLNFGQGQQMLPWQQGGAYSNIIGGPQVLSSGTSLGSSSGKGVGASGGGKK